MYTLNVNEVGVVVFPSEGLAHRMKTNQCSGLSLLGRPKALDVSTLCHPGTTMHKGAGKGGVSCLLL